MWNPSTSTPITLPPDLSWLNALDLDFSVLGNTTFGSNQSYVVNGKSWTKENSANEASALAISGGNLVWAPVAATLIATSTRTAPLFRSLLSSHISTFHAFMPLRLWMYVTSDNPVVSGTTNDDVFIGVCLPTNAYFVQAMRGVGIPSPGTRALGFSIKYTITSADISNQSTSQTPDSSNRVVLLEFPHGIAGDARLALGAASGAGIWPALASMKPTVFSNCLDTDFSSGGAQDLATNANVVLGCYRNGNATAYTASIGRVAIDYRNLT